MTSLADGLVLAIDTTSRDAGVAFFEGRELLAETTWRTHESHSRQLLPAVDWLLGHVERTKAEISALVVCLGPGSYAGMRVGLSTAKTLAYALDVPVVGIGRLAADALPLAEATGGRVMPVQAAGRAELAFAAYRMQGFALQEELAPRLGSLDVLVANLTSGTVVCGETDRLDDVAVAALERAGARTQASMTPRSISLGRLGLERLAAGEFDNGDALVPLYLRAPAIGPQPPR